MVEFFIEIVDFSSIYGVHRLVWRFFNAGRLSLCLLVSVIFVLVCLHHHSFAYLNQVRWFNRLALALTRQQFHVVLCQLMADLLVEKYNIVERRVRVVSNAAFLPIQAAIPFAVRDQITVGFLSNVTEG